MTYRWSIAETQVEAKDLLCSALHISPLLACCLVNRGLSRPEQAAAFLDPRLKSLSDPYLLPNMDQAVERLISARSARERVVIFGDYDVDGLTSTTLLLDVLKKLGWNVECYLPHRFDEGYGLSREGVERCLQQYQPSLLVALDCGSTAVATIDWLNQLQVDVLVVDHHQLANPPPAAKALLNPRVSAGGAPSASDHLCSVGLAFKLAHALVKQGRQEGWPQAQMLDLREYLDLTALGTVADMVPLLGENRIFVSAGLERLGRTARPGLQALMRVAGITSPVGVHEVGFQLAPRLNAAGRIEEAQAALNLLQTPHPEEANHWANLLDSQNRQRQGIERTMAEEAMATLKTRFNPQTDYFIVEGRESWHIGVVGIVAARVLRCFYRPTIILGGEGTEWRGSGRSIEGLDLAEALRRCDDLLVRHGGHAMAAGLTVRADQVSALRQRLNEWARRTLTPEQLLPKLRLDADVPLKEITLDRLKELSRMEPSGQGNPPVQLRTRKVVCQRPAQRIGKQQQHLRLWLTDGSATLEAIWWGAGQGTPPQGRFDIAYAPEISEYNGSCRVRLRLLDWQAG